MGVCLSTPRGEGELRVPQGTYPPARSGWGRGYTKVPNLPPLQPSQDGGYPKVPTPPARSGWGGVPQGTYPPGQGRYPPARMGEWYPKVPTASPRQGRYPPAKDLLHGRQYTSYVHAGGFSCFILCLAGDHLKT